MTDKKFTDEEIINYLTEILIASTNGYSEHLANGGRIDKSQEQELEMLTEIINIINRQKSEIERLKECPKCVYEYDGEVTEYCVQGPCPNFKTVEQIKTEAYKEFAMKLQAFCKRIIAQKWNEKAAPISWSYAYADFIDDIDNLLKEMVGEEE